MHFHYHIISSHFVSSSSGPMKLVVIDLSRVAHLFPLLDRDQLNNKNLRTTSYNDYRIQLSNAVENPELLTEQEMYALYCYYYGKAVQRILSDNPGRFAVTFSILLYFVVHIRSKLQHIIFLSQMNI